MTSKKFNAKSIAKGAAGVAAAAGVVAGVAALADKETRNSVIKGAGGFFKASGGEKVVDTVGSQFKATAHQIRLGNNKKTSRKRTAKTAKQQHNTGAE